MLIAISLPARSGTAALNYVAVGDVHGDFDHLVAILQKAGVIDQQQHWQAGELTLIQVGDLIDRGPKPKEVMDLMIALEGDAQKANGRVLCLLGNHEVMNLFGDLRYVTPDNFASFSDGKSEERRQKAWQQFTKWRKDHAALVAELPASFNPAEQEWMSHHPLGFVEQREAFGPQGKYGKWIRTHPTVVKVGDVVFLHGGLDTDVAELGLDVINKRIQEEIHSFDTTKKYLSEQQVILPFFTMQEVVAVVQAQIRVEQATHVPAEKQLQFVIAPFLKFGDWLSMKANSPLWFRGYDEWNEVDGATKAAAVLNSCGAKAVVVGHTPQKSGLIRSRFGGKIFLIDTGMLSSYYPGGKASALEIRGEEVAAEYLAERLVLQPANAETPKTSTVSPSHQN